MTRSPDPNKVAQQIADTIAAVQEVLSGDLLGMYLYGSSVYGELQWSSDIDLFVVSDLPTTHDDKVRLVARLLNISPADESSGRRPIELTIVDRAAITPWRYPPSFDFQYGEWMRAEFASGDVQPWSTNLRPDVALLMTQVSLASQTLYGQEPRALFDPAPYRDFMTAAVDQLESLLADLEPDTRNVLLTFARIWSTVETDAIRSKPDAAAWVIKRLPAMYRPVMQRARAICLGQEPDQWDDINEMVSSCAEFMVGRIRAHASTILASNTDGKSIRLAAR